MSTGTWSFSDGWVSTGLLLWAVAAVGGELVLWPAERRLQAAVADPGLRPDLRNRCRRVVAAAAVMFVVLIVATVVMVAKP